MMMGSPYSNHFLLALPIALIASAVMTPINCIAKNYMLLSDQSDKFRT